MLEWIHLPMKKGEVDDLDTFESTLRKALRPVEPSPNFVRELHSGLVSIPVLVSPASSSKIPVVIAMTIAGLLSGVALIGIVVWLIIYLVGRIRTDDKHGQPPPRMVVFSE